MRGGQVYPDGYGIWIGMRQRCRDPRRKHYPYYGGRGIRVCPQWDASFESFMKDMGPRPAGASIERIDNNGNYEPANCRWATPKEQARNRTVTRYVTVDGVREPLNVWADRLGVASDTLIHRLSYGWTEEQTVKTPIRRRGDKRSLRVPS